MTAVMVMLDDPTPPRHEELRLALESCGYHWLGEGGQLLGGRGRVIAAFSDPVHLEDVGMPGVTELQGRLWERGVDFAMLLGGNSAIVYVPSDQLKEARQIMGRMLDSGDAR